MLLDPAHDRALSSLCALAAGDALGSQFFVPANRGAFTTQTLPPGPWQWTDDAEMACSVVAVLREYGHVDQDALARSFAIRHDFDRGYGPGVNRLLRLVREGGDWRSLARDQFGGQGSFGNGAAMRVAPLGHWYAGEPALAAEQAALSAVVTHAHPEGIAGAVAVAVAASLPLDGPDLLSAVAAFLDPGPVCTGVLEAATLPPSTDPADAARALGNGREVSAQDTVPFTLWIASRYRTDPLAAFWATAAAGGDVDTTCAIVLGILAEPVPADWLTQVERLPDWLGSPGWPIARPMPIPPPARVWTAAEWQRIRSGWRPHDMDDRWQAHLDGEVVHIQRSWTGFGVYAARFAEHDTGWSITEALTESDPDRYRLADPAAESAQLERVVDLIAGAEPG
jgi:ADP-ribosylglycohydrolase